MSHDVVVIGAGVSGLSCANDLVGMGMDVRILERQVTTGGNARSERFDGFLMEYGPSTVNAAFPTAMDRIRHLGLEPDARPLGPGVTKRYLRDERGLHGISIHPMGFFTSRYLSPFTRLSMAAEFLRPAKSDKAEETIHQFVSRRFGAGFADKVIEPLAAGLFMGDSKTLSVSGTFPKLVDLEERFGSIMRGILAAKRGREPGRHLLSWDGGIGTLPRTLAERLGARIHPRTTVTKITRTPAGFKIATANSGTIFARAVVLAVQPHVASALLENLDPQSAAAAGDIPAPPIGVVYLGYRKDQVSHHLDGLGFLSTKNDGQVISGAQFCSTMFEGRAPAGHVSVSCYLGGARNPELTNLPENDLINLVSGELSGLLGIKGGPVLARAHRWPRGLPHYTLGHVDRRKAIETADQRVPGLFLTGNFLQGVSITNCLETASATAKKVQAALERVTNLDVGNERSGKKS
ncbi:Protoporphyrinogen IX oxidase, aerobic, HemY [hydrothermal vent metagenome]|uniref:Protoporphyrinogen IX oxidase, aerobic, HemY n=1 Tax=hydrothermal vent metagenome TaxID=652676 RepID=A0A3B0SUR7_9ZZZZ